MDLSEQLTADLWLLDAILTGHDPRSGRGDENQIVDFEKFVFGELHYLSDGGYSRVYYSIQDHRLFVARESLQEVKDRWMQDEAVLQIRRRIERRIDCWIAHPQQ